jgi:hypothetical protein
MGEGEGASAQDNLKQVKLVSKSRLIVLGRPGCRQARTGKLAKKPGSLAKGVTLSLSCSLAGGSCRLVNHQNASSILRLPLQWMIALTSLA